jgi:plasmid maintenance system antidote protein VapI
MENGEHLTYEQLLQKRLKRVLEIIDLEEVAFAEFIGYSVPHIYAVLNGTRALAPRFAKAIGNKLGFPGENIFNLNYEIPDKIKKSRTLNNFKSEYKYNDEYFLSTIIDRKRSKLVEETIIQGDFLYEYKYLSEIKTMINSSISKKDKFDSDELSKILNYLVSQGKLIKDRMRIKLKTGRLGIRIVDVFSKGKQING